MNFIYLPVVVSAAFAMAMSGASAATLDDVKSRGFVRCGVSPGLPGFSNRDDSGAWSGFDVDYCRAVAAAIFNDPAKVKFTSLSKKRRFTALRSGKIDVLSGNTRWTFGHDAALGLNFVGVTYYDGQGFMVRKSLGMSGALDLSGASVCVQTGTSAELILVDYFRANKLEYKIVAFKQLDDANFAYEEGHCDVFTAGTSSLYAKRLELNNPGAHMVLPEVIPTEQLGPVVRQDDDHWINLNKAVLNALINAEELGVTAASVEDMKGSANSAIKRLLGVEGAFDEALGLSREWAIQMIKGVGNYGEIFDRNVGPATPLKILRGVNALSSNGGNLFAPPVP